MSSHPDTSAGTSACSNAAGACFGDLHDVRFWRFGLFRFSLCLVIMDWRRTRIHCTCEVDGHAQQHVYDNADHVCVALRQFSLRRLALSCLGSEYRSPRARADASSKSRSRGRHERRALQLLFAVWKLCTLIDRLCWNRTGNATD